jgi:hypothetical protein
MFPDRPANGISPSHKRSITMVARFRYRLCGKRLRRNGTGLMHIDDPRGSEIYFSNLYVTLETRESADKRFSHYTDIDHVL